MTIIYSHDGSVIPMAIVGGALPDRQHLESVIKKFKHCRLANPPGRSKQDLEHLFVDISQHLNAYLQDKKGPDTLEHYFISTGPQSQLTSEVQETTHVSKSLSPLERVLSEFGEQGSSISLITDLKSESEQRLKEYVLFWTTVTGLKLQPESHYKDITRFREACESIFDSVKTQYADPLHSFLSEVRGSGAHYSSIH